MLTNWSEVKEYDTAGIIPYACDQKNVTVFLMTPMAQAKSPKFSDFGTTREDETDPIKTAARGFLHEFTGRQVPAQPPAIQIVSDYVKANEEYSQCVYFQDKKHVVFFVQMCIGLQPGTRCMWVPANELRNHCRNPEFLTDRLRMTEAQTEGFVDWVAKVQKQLSEGEGKSWSPPVPVPVNVNKKPEGKKEESPAEKPAEPTPAPQPEPTPPQQPTPQPSVPQQQQPPAQQPVPQQQTAPAVSPAVQQQQPPQQQQQQQQPQAGQTPTQQQTMQQQMQGNPFAGMQFPGMGTLPGFTIGQPGQDGAKAPSPTAAIGASMGGGNQFAGLLTPFTGIPGGATPFSLPSTGLTGGPVPEFNMDGAWGRNTGFQQGFGSRAAFPSAFDYLSSYPQAQQQQPGMSAAQVGLGGFGNASPTAAVPTVTASQFGFQPATHPSTMSHAAGINMANFSPFNFGRSGYYPQGQTGLAQQGTQGVSAVNQANPTAATTTTPSFGTPQFGTTVQGVQGLQQSVQGVQGAQQSAGFSNQFAQRGTIGNYYSGSTFGTGRFTSSFGGMNTMGSNQFGNVQSVGGVSSVGSVGGVNTLGASQFGQFQNLGGVQGAGVQGLQSNVGNVAGGVRIGNGFGQQFSSFGQQFGGLSTGQSMGSFGGTTAGFGGHSFHF